MKCYIDKVIVPFVSEKRRQLKLDPTSPAAAIFDNFRGQTTDTILSLLRSHHIVPIQLPANCTDKLQPLPLCQVKVDVGLQVVKIPSANWIISGWQELEKRPEVAVNGFKIAGILDAINL